MFIETKRLHTVMYMGIGQAKARGTPIFWAMITPGRTMTKKPVRTAHHTAKGCRTLAARSAAQLVVPRSEARSAALF